MPGAKRQLPHSEFESTDQVIAVRRLARRVAAALSATSDTQSSRNPRVHRVGVFGYSTSFSIPTGRVPHYNHLNEAWSLQHRAQLRIGPTDRRRDDHEAADDLQHICDEDGKPTET